jgi:hypothetical protein
MNGGASGFKTRRGSGVEDSEGAGVDEDVELEVFAAVMAALYAAKNWGLMLPYYLLSEEVTDGRTTPLAIPVIGSNPPNPLTASDESPPVPLNCPSVVGILRTLWIWIGDCGECCGRGVGRVG